MPSNSKVNKNYKKQSLSTNTQPKSQNKNYKKQSSSANTQPKSQRHAWLKVNAELLKVAKQTAHTIVLNLLEVGVSKEYFADQIRYITPEHYNDVVTERSIAGVCGYSLCNSVLTQMYGNQTYIIRHNKVYDVTQRRHFCSDKCYEASELVLDQVPSSPLYLRTSDKDIKKFKLLLPDLTRLKGRYGRLVSITGTAPDVRESLVDRLGSSFDSESEERNTPEESQNVKPHSFHTTHESTSSRFLDSNINLSATEGDTSTTKTSISSCAFGLSPSQNFPQDSSVMSTDSEAYLSEEAQKLNLDDSPVDMNAFLPKGPLRPTLRSDGKKVQKEKVCTTEFGRSEEGNEACAEPSLEHIYEVERALREWMTFESLRTILGDNYVRGMLEELGKVWEDYDSTADLRLGIESKSRYIALCQGLDASERREKIWDANDSLANPEDADKQQLELRPMPNYEQLKKDVEQSSVKVKAFYEGKEVESCQESLETIYEENEPSTDALGKKRKGKPEEKKEDEVDAVTLPLIDTYSQKAWRRQIVMERLNKPLSCYALDFRLDEREIIRLVTSLVATFDLTAHNISFKMRQWKLVALVIFKMLSVRYPVIEETIIPNGKGFDHVTLFLRDEGLDPEYLNRLLSYLTEISYILTKYHKHTDVSRRSDASTAKEGETNWSDGKGSSRKGKGRKSSEEGKLLTSSDTKMIDEYANFHQDKPYTKYEELD